MVTTRIDASRADHHADRGQQGADRAGAEGFNAEAERLGQEGTAACGRHCGLAALGPFQKLLGVRARRVVGGQRHGEVLLEETARIFKITLVLNVDFSLGKKSDLDCSAQSCSAFARL